MMLAITKLVETIERLLFPRRRERGVKHQTSARSPLSHGR